MPHWWGCLDLAARGAGGPQWPVGGGGCAGGWSGVLSRGAAENAEGSRLLGVGRGEQAKTTARSGPTPSRCRQRSTRVARFDRCGDWGLIGARPTASGRCPSRASLFSGAAARLRALRGCGRGSASTAPRPAARPTDSGRSNSRRAAAAGRTMSGAASSWRRSVWPLSAGGTPALVNPFPRRAPRTLQPRPRSPTSRVLPAHRTF